MLLLQILYACRLKIRCHCRKGFCILLPNFIVFQFFEKNHWVRILHISILKKKCSYFLGHILASTNVLIRKKTHCYAMTQHILISLKLANLCREHILVKSHWWASNKAFTDANLKKKTWNTSFANMQFINNTKKMHDLYLLPFWRYFIDTISTGGRIIWSFFLMTFRVVLQFFEILYYLFVIIQAMFRKMNMFKNRIKIYLLQ